MGDVNEFYVGYLKAPPRIAVFLRWSAPTLILAMLGLAWRLSGAQNDPGDGVWHDESESLVGRIGATPYPHVCVLSKRADHPIETILLVSEGKHGGGERVAALAGQIARVRGTIVERDGIRLLELADDELLERADSLSPADAADLAASETNPRRDSLGRVTLQGEIIDPKCYSGAMKPGEGKAHKECATLCIAGGIPPMFVTLDAAGKRSYFLLTDPAGRALEGRVLHEQVLPFVADAVEISGELEMRDDLALLRIDPTSIRRL
ncbi:MAG: hypothetical protein HZB38_00470 [Planctomycetes bacterium]|nr:hypothetical protein [Planctomycetota bacterium]